MKLKMAGDNQVVLVEFPLLGVGVLVANIRPNIRSSATSIGAMSGQQISQITLEMSQKKGVARTNSKGLHQGP